MLSTVITIGCEIILKPATLHLDVVISEDLESYKSVDVVIETHETTISIHGAISEVTGLFGKYQGKTYFLKRHPDFPIDFDGISSVTVNQIVEDSIDKTPDLDSSKVSLKYLGKAALKTSNASGKH